MILPTPFPVARYRLEFVTERPIRLPEYAGSALRGAFGHGLKRTACMTRERDCKACPLYRTCPYPAIFETPPPADYTRREYSNIPNPFVVEPPPWGSRFYKEGDPLVFGLVLIGPALRQLPLIVFSWQRALARGVGREDGTARLARVWLDGDDEPLLDDPAGRLRDHDPAVVLPKADAGEELTLEFYTPLRLQRDGHVLGVAKLTPRDLLMGLVRRAANLIEMQLGEKLEADFPALNRTAAEIEGEKALSWRDWTRYSNRQQQDMVLGGAVGRWTLRGHLAPFWQLLYLGQWLHVGKNATFGLGGYRIVGAPPT